MDEKITQLFLWYGDNDYEIFEKTCHWRQVFEKKYTGLNIMPFDLSSAGPKDKFESELKNALQVNSLFGMNKLIIFRNFLTAKNKLSAEMSRMISKSLENILPGFFVVFCQTEKPDARGIIYKQIKSLEKKKLAEVKEFKLPRQAELVKWILAKAKKYQVTLSPEAINSLSAMIGSDLWQLDREIHKLANYKKGEKVTTEDINLMVKGKYNDDIFQLMDAISDKNKKKVLKLFQDQLASGANEIYLLTMLVRQFRIFWQMKELTKNNQMSTDLVAKELGLHPYVAKKSMYYLKNFSLEQLKNIYRQLLDFEIKMKTTSLSFEVLFDLLVAGL